MTPEARRIIPRFESGRKVEQAYGDRLDLRGLRESLPSRRACIEMARRLPDLYPRDGFRALLALEERISELAGVEAGALLAFPTGMTAIRDAIDSARPGKGTTLLFGHQHYTEIPRLVNFHLRGRGVNVLRRDSGSPEQVAEAIERHSPDIVLFEVVANSPEMPVLNLASLFDAVNANAKKPLLIIDNTMTTPTLVPPSLLFGGIDARVVVVESGTKTYALNSEMLGIAYTNDHALYLDMYNSRITFGSTPTPSSVGTISQAMPESKGDFDARNALLFRNTLSLAEACARAADENQRIAVIHPNLPGHPGQDLAGKLSVDGITPVFFISTPVDQFELTDRLFENPAIAKHCQIRQSFGFENTVIYPQQSDFEFIRIAGGTEPESIVKELGNALESSLRKA